jgi:O-antigen biosynthesis protein
MTADSMSAPQLTVVIATHDNLDHLRRCLDGWERWASDQPVEVIVVEDGCTDGTVAYLTERASTPWGRRHLRWVHEDDAHELMCTNRGLREARAPLVLSWHDDMELRSGWMVPEILATFEAYPEIGLLALSRALYVSAPDEPIESWHDTVDWRRLRSTIGPEPGNWFRLYEVDAVIRPWVVRRACVERVGALDEAYRPTEWDESDLCYRIREAGWHIAVHGYERDEAYIHALSSTFGRTPSERRMAIGLANGRRFFDRWSEVIRREEGRTRRSWRRAASAVGWVATLRAAARQGARRLLRRS